MDSASGVEQPKRYVAIFYVLAAVVLGLFLEQVITGLLSMSFLRVNNPEFATGWSLATVLGFGLAAVIAVVVWRIPKTQAISLEVALELKRVTWPSLRETRAATVAVVVASLVASIILGVFDFIWRQLSALVY